MGYTISATHHEPSDFQLGWRVTSSDFSGCMHPQTSGFGDDHRTFKLAWSSDCRLSKHFGVLHIFVNLGYCLRLFQQLIYSINLIPCYDEEGPNLRKDMTTRKKNILLHSDHTYSHIVELKWGPCKNIKETFFPSIMQYSNKSLRKPIDLLEGECIMTHLVYSQWKCVLGDWFNSLGWCFIIILILILRAALHVGE